MSGLPSLAMACAALAMATAAAATDNPRNALCNDGSQRLCPTLPVDIPGVSVLEGYFPNTNVVTREPSDGVRPEVAQVDFDYFAWQMFVALNWPADETGNPLPNTSITSNLDAPRVWEAFPTDDAIYGGGSLPVCPANGRLVVGDFSKITSNSFIEPFTPYPLIDTAGNFVVYDVRVNPTEADYVAWNGLDTVAGQQRFDQAGGTWDFPRGQGITPGAIELKTAWRVFQSETDAQGFFTVPATVVVAGKNSATGETLCLDVTLGLVGMHIMQKIANPATFSDYWVWATFEHVRNAPDSTEATPSLENDDAVRTNTEFPPLASCTAPASTPGDWSFYNAACTSGGSACATNDPPALPADRNYLWQTQPPYAQTYLTDGTYGTQVARCWAIYQSAVNVSGQFQTALGGSVWSSYELVGTQWAQQSSGGEFLTPLTPFPAPIYLTNTTLETYLQLDPVIDPATKKPNRNASGSCIICHALATDSQKKPSNFSFLPGHVAAGQ